MKSPDSDNATGFTVDHNLHRIRREALGSFFSKRIVTLLEPTIKAKIDEFCQRLDGFVGTNAPINLSVASLALTMDILTEYTFAEGFGLLKQEDFNVKWKDTILCIMQALPIIRHFQWLFRIIGTLPNSVARPPASEISELLGWKEVSCFINFFICTLKLLNRFLQCFQPRLETNA